MARTKRPASERVFCACCNKLVSPNTRHNHLKGRHGGPAVQAAALTYRQQVLAAAPLAEVEVTPAITISEEAHEPIAGPSNSENSRKIFSTI